MLVEGCEVVDDSWIFVLVLDLKCYRQILWLFIGEEGSFGYFEELLQSKDFVEVLCSGCVKSYGFEFSVMLVQEK